MPGTIMCLKYLWNLHPPLLLRDISLYWYIRVGKGMVNISLMVEFE